MKDDYKLSPEEHEKYLDIIIDTYLSSGNTVESPVIFVLGGQPGCGKSKLIELDIKRMQEEGCVVINGDEFRTNHPHALEIYEKHEDKFAEYTDPDVREWTQQVFAKAIENNYNIIFEGTMRTNMICNTIKGLQEKGYKVNIQALAVNELESRLSIYYRYEEQLKEGQISRFTEQKSHDDAYNGMLNTLQQIEDETLYDNLEVFNRNKDVLFKSSKQYPMKGAVDAVVKHRQAVWSKTKYDDYIEDANFLENEISDRNGKQEWILDIENLKKASKDKIKVPASKEIVNLMSSLLKCKE